MFLNFPYLDIISHFGNLFPFSEAKVPQLRTMVFHEFVNSPMKWKQLSLHSNS
jgi:hypothetical protein